jgi:hypothetical protein
LIDIIGLSPSGFRGGAFRSASDLRMMVLWGLQSEPFCPCPTASHQV